MKCINKYHKNLRFLGVLFFIFFIGITSAFAFEPDNELFTDAPQSSVTYADQDKAQQNPTIVRSRHVNIIFDLLAEEKDVSSDSQGVDSIALNLFDEVSFIAINERVERRSSSSYTWFGWISESEVGQVILAVEDGHMAGNITIGIQMYQVRGVGNGVHAIYEIDQSAFPDELPPIPGENLDTSDVTPDASQQDSGSIIDVMVVYTDDVAIASANIASEIQLAIDEANQSYANSGINQRLRLVHSHEVNYVETGNMGTDLTNVTSTNDGILDEVHIWRDTYCADMVSFWVEDGGGYCGIAWLMQTVSNSFKTNAFSVVQRTCATGYYSFGHEFGHNMGAHHDRANASGQGAYSYSYGYQDPNRNWRTIMAYNCPGYCTRLQYWSNPDILYNNDPMGVPEGQPGSADNRKTLNNTAYTVANFRQMCTTGTTVTITATDPNAAEPRNIGKFKLTRTGPTTSDLIVRVARKGTATNKLDYRNIRGRVKIRAGRSFKTIRVVPINDAIVEGSENVVVAVKSDAAYIVGSPNEATVVITDND